MKSTLALIALSALFASATLSAAEKETAKPAVAAVSPTAAAQDSTTLATPEASEPQRNWSLGLGYPDARLRVAFAQNWSVEAKTALGSGMQIYGGRLNYNFFNFGPVRALVGTEAGYIKLDGLETLTGDGSYGQGYLGFDWQVTRRVGLEIDGGPALIRLQAEGQSVSATELLFNAAVYLNLW